MAVDDHKYSKTAATINPTYNYTTSGWAIYRYNRIVTCHIVGIKNITTKNQSINVGTVPAGYIPAYGAYYIPIGHKSGGVLNSNVKFLFTFTDNNNGGIIYVCQYTNGSVDTAEFAIYSDTTWICSK